MGKLALGARKILPDLGSFGPSQLAYNGRKAKMGIIVLIVAVMYFALLNARFEGERYAPTKIEKWLVVGGLSLVMLTFTFFVCGSWFRLCLGAATIYPILIPVRMMLRIKIWPIEAWLTIGAIFVAFVTAIILPLFTHY